MGIFDRLKGAVGSSGKKDGGRFPADMKGPDGHPMVGDGPFPIATPEGRLNCKNCGTTYDSATVRQAQGVYAGDPDPAHMFTHFCRKCSTHSVFPREDIAAFPALPGMTSTPLNQRLMGGGDRQVKFAVEGPLPIFDPDNRLLCRSCGMPFDEAAYEAWRKNIMQFLNMLTSKGIIVVQCTNCQVANAYAIGNDPRLKPFVQNLLASVRD